MFSNRKYVSQSSIPNHGLISNILIRIEACFEDEHTGNTLRTTSSSLTSPDLLLVIVPVPHYNNPHYLLHHLQSV